MQMLILCVGLMLVGAIILCVEMFMPSFGIIGIVGLVMMIASFIVTILCLPFGGFIVAGEIVCLAVLGFFAFRYIKRRQLYGKLILDETLNEDKKDIGQLEFFLGKEGVTKTPLRPQGEADFNGTSIEVFSSGPYIPEARAIKVIAIENQKLIVKAVQ